MRKNQSRSPLTGLRKLSTDPQAASAIRRALANVLRTVASIMGDDNGYIHMGMPPAPSYIYADAEARVTPAQIETFGYELVAKDILRDIDRHPTGGVQVLSDKTGMDHNPKGQQSTNRSTKRCVHYRRFKPTETFGSR
jgi:hypothetical protein